MHLCRNAGGICCSVSWDPTINAAADSSVLLYAGRNLYAARTYDSHSRSFRRTESKPVGQGTPPLRGPTMNGTPARRHLFANRLGIVGLSGVTRCTMSQSPRRIALPNFFQTSDSK